MNVDGLETKSKVRSRIMSSVKSEGMAIEDMVERILLNRGVALEKHSRSSVGRHDFFIVDKKIAIFLEGDFWNGIEIDSNPWLKAMANRDFWLNKIERNIGRDRIVNTKLVDNGCWFFRFWEHDIMHNSGGVKLRKLMIAL